MNLSNAFKNFQPTHIFEFTLFLLDFFFNRMSRNKSIYYQYQKSFSHVICFIQFYETVWIINNRRNDRWPIWEKGSDYFGINIKSRV